MTAAGPPAGLQLPLVRAHAETLMTSTCRVYTAGQPVTDPDTGAVTTGENVVYEGRCRVRPGGRGTQTASDDSVGAEQFPFDYLISVPFTVTTITEGQRLRVTASADPALVGVDVQIQRVDRGDHLSARRLACQEVT